jgi:uncharacterized protein YecE (DUF72 family)
MKYQIGCSGWQYPEWRGHFYPRTLPKRQWFEYYAQHFVTVEINYSFYCFPAATTVQKWYQQAPAEFRFSLKIPRVITHYHKFHNTQKLLSDFYSLADLLEEKLSCLLLQLPAVITYDPALLDRIITQLDVHKKHAIEFRHESWWQEEVYQKLAAANIVFCSVSAPQLPTPLIISNDQIYCRLHGKNQWYKEHYAERELQQLATLLQNKSLQEAWVYFDNSMDASAPFDAEKLNKLLHPQNKGERT